MGTSVGTTLVAFVGAPCAAASVFSFRGCVPHARCGFVGAVRSVLWRRPCAGDSAVGRYLSGMFPGCPRLASVGSDCMLPCDAGGGSGVGLVLGFV